MKFRGLVVFDVEGVILPERRYIMFEVLELVDFMGFLKILFYGSLYEIGLLRLEYVLKKIFRLFKGAPADKMFRLYERVPLMIRVREVFQKLEERGYKLAIISSGLPKVFIEDLAKKLGADYAFGLDLELDEDERLTGEISGEVLKENGKAIVLDRLLRKIGFSKEDCVLVVDDRNNIPMFPFSALNIGFNPDFLVSIKSDNVVKEDITEILPIIEGKNPPRKLSKGDVFRETIHIGSFLIPFVCRFLLNVQTIALLIFLTAILYLISEIAKMKGLNFPIFSAITKKASTKAEIHTFTTAPLFFALGILIPLLMLPQPIGYAAIAILTLGDGTATLFGKKLGKIRFPINKGKTLEATIIGTLVAFLGASIFIGFEKAFIGSLIGMLFEFLPLPISDNLTVPITSSLVMLLT